MSKPKSSLTQDKMTAHNAKAMLVSCMDFRLREDIHKFMKEHGYDVNYDQFVLAGVSLGVVQQENPHWGSSLMEHIEISKSLHHITKVILMDHLDCGAYKTFCPHIKSEADEYEEHKKNLALAEAKIKEKFPDLVVKKKIMHLDGKVDKIK